MVNSPDRFLIMCARNFSFKILRDTVVAKTAFIMDSLGLIALIANNP